MTVTTTSRFKHKSREKRAIGLTCFCNVLIYNFYDLAKLLKYRFEVEALRFVPDDLNMIGEHAMCDVYAESHLIQVINARKKIKTYWLICESNNGEGEITFDGHIVLSPRTTDDIQYYSMSFKRS